ncbi:MAG TPA: hypothetical protein VK912_04320 [Longimicrobiales bacterium]|nr:hypothetical protein [Longimicrobiales bacterium]
MRRAGVPMRAWVVVIACAAGLSACRDNGLADRNLPLEEAQNREYGYQVYQAAPATPAIAMGGRHWVASQTVETIPAHVLVPVGTAEGTQLFARRGEEAPYGRLWAQVSQDRWTPYLRLN